MSFSIHSEVSPGALYNNDNNEQLNHSSYWHHKVMPICTSVRKKLYSITSKNVNKAIKSVYKNHQLKQCIKTNPPHIPLIHIHNQQSPSFRPFNKLLSSGHKERFQFLLIFEQVILFTNAFREKVPEFRPDVGERTIPLATV